MTNQEAFFGRGAYSPGFRYIRFSETRVIAYEEVPSEYCRNENASSLSFPQGSYWEVPSASVWEPGYLPKETRGFASPPHDGFAFLAEHPRRCVHAACTKD